MVQREKHMGDRRLERAAEHVNNFWFPVNRALLDRLREAVATGVYDTDSAGLVREIQGDFALFTFALREVAAMLREEGVATPEQKDPCGLLTWAGTERLQRVLAREAAAISPHTFSAITEVQRVRLEEAIISASTSQAFFTGIGLNPNLAYSASVLRHLGYALVAWNYSQIYQKAIFSLHPGEGLDMAITRLLGFSPTSLALRVMSDWGISPELLSVVRGEDYVSTRTSDGDLESAAIVKTLGRVCRIGEALARANNPELYPSAKKDWSFAYEEVEATLGKGGLANISQRVEENSRAYLTLIPELFKGGIILDPEAKIRGARAAQASYEPNPFVELCNPTLKRELEELYARMGEGLAPQDYLRHLVKRVVPQAGFFRGCVFTVDPALGALVPQLGVGEARTSDFPATRYAAEAGDDDAILQAFHTNKVIVTAVSNNPDQPVTAVARAIGYSQRVGVLYLETREMIFNVLESNVRTEFNAIAYTLDDCLRLVS